MSLRKPYFEKAVNNLLTPAHYEFLLFVQNQIKKDRHDLQHHEQKRAGEVIRLVRQGNVRVPPFSTGEAISVLTEAMRRLR